MQQLGTFLINILLKNNLASVQNIDDEMKRTECYFCRGMDRVVCEISRAVATVFERLQRLDSDQLRVSGD